MNRPVSILTKLALAMAVGECLSAVVIAVEDYADSVPAFAVLFAVLFFTGAWLLHRRRIIAGASLVGLLALFEIVNYPAWQKHNTYDWVSDTVYVILSAVTLALAVRTLASRRRRPARA